VRPETLLGYVRATPFKPFRIVLNSGRSYEVRHPELIRVGRDCFIVFYAKTPDGPFDGWDTASLLLVEHVELLEAPAAA